MNGGVGDEFIALQEALSGEYSIERELGRGGMGVVYLAREVQLDRFVAIKVLPRALAADARVCERFLREARMAASLSHPNIVPIYRVGEARAGDAAGAPYFIMAYVAGETLGDRLRRRGPVSPAVAVQLFREVSWALAYAHRSGIIHRDVKPDNILIEEGTGRALVTDFGIARSDRSRLDQGPEAEEPPGIAGTAQFMSPEQLSGAPLDGRSDLYSLGVTAFLAVTGQMPFAGETPGSIMRAHAHNAPRPVATALPSVPRFLGDAIDRCLRKARAERFEDGEALGAALRANVSTRAELPEPLRAWVTARDPLTSFYLLVSGFSAVSLARVLLIDVRFGIHPAAPTLLTTLVLAPLLPAAAFQLRSLSAVLRSGFSLSDLRRALAVRARDIEAQRKDEPPDTLMQRCGRVAARTIVGSAAALFAMDSFGITRGTYFGMGSVFVLFIGIPVIPISAAFGFPIIRRGLSDHLFGLRSRFWNSTLGGWIADKLAPRAGVVAPQFAHRPTETALGAAILDLFASLPIAYRAGLGDLDAVVHRLEDHASAARAQVDAIDLQSMDARHPAPAVTRDVLASERAAAQRELARAVTALESIRLGLLRLHGGSMDLQPITTVLDAARDIDADLRRLREAEDEVGLDSAWSDAESEPLTPV